MDRVNHAWYSRPEAVAAFSGDDLLEPALVLLLLRYRDRIADHDVLDIGVGAGRTTRYLSALTNRYVGIDYSPSMVAHCVGRFPGVRIELMDARDLSAFSDASYDLVLFSYGGIGALGPDSRGAALHEICRVLRPGGIYLFSAHNREFEGARLGPSIAWSRNPVTLLANVVRWVGMERNHRRIRKLEVETPEYALINDVAERYSLLHYYITAPAQRLQLEHAGLELVSVIDDTGVEVSPESRPTQAPWLWYVARRPG